METIQATLDEGTRWRRVFRFWSVYTVPGAEGNVPLNLTGWTASAQMRRDVGTGLLQNIIGQTDLANGLVEIVIDDTNRKLPDGKWDLCLTPPNDGDPWYPVGGPVTISRTVTRTPNA